MTGVAEVATAELKGLLGVTMERGGQVHDKIRSDGFQEFYCNMWIGDNNYENLSIFTLGRKYNKII